MVELNTKPLLTYKPIFQQFVEANVALIDCYEAIDKNELASMARSAMDAKCVNEKNTLKKILDSN